MPSGSILGNAVVRKEDPRLLRGRGTFTANLDLDGVLCGVFVRSVVAHALINGIDTSVAEAMDGVELVMTGADIGIDPFLTIGASNPTFARPPLATDRVRFVGEPVALVVAATFAQAVDAAEAVVVDYDPLPVVVDPEAAIAADAPQIFPGVIGNIALAVTGPADDDLFADAAAVVRGRFVNQRMAAMPMEPNAFAAEPDPDVPGGIKLWASTQMPHGLRLSIAPLLGLDAGLVRVIAPNVGGSFGAKIGVYHEFVGIAVAAERLQRPVRWVETRSEDLIALSHGRAQIHWVEMGFTSAGRITGMRARVLGDTGAYPGLGSVMAAGPTHMLSQGVYEIPKIDYGSVAVATNTTPVGAFRGAGRPEATALLERIMDMAAAELGIDPAEIRRNNFIADDAFPYATRTGVTYDSGEYAKPLDEALRVAGYDDLRGEQQARRDRHDTVQLGIGISTYVEITAGGFGTEWGGVEVNADGGATIRVGTSAHGQGHDTTFSMLVSDRLGIPMERIDFVQSDTALVPQGSGTGGSRSLQIGGTAVLQATDAVLDKAKTLAAHLLEAAPDDIVLDDSGGLRVAGVPASVLSWAELARAASDPLRRPDGWAEVVPPGGEDQAQPDGLGAAVVFNQADASFPFGAHVAVVEVDTETGRVGFLRHIAVDDCGFVLNPLVVAGQQHGGIAAGAGQALFEEILHDSDGNPQTATLIDYLMPAASEFPSFEVSNTETLSPLNPLGVKGIGEAGTIGATPAVQNAVIDALSHLGIRHLDMPISPQRIWAAVQAARAGETATVWTDPPAALYAAPDPGGAPSPSELEAAAGA
ncbi:MAG TPA: xanthine dehydrogenase family protein molybdopterin-binding subunit [Acidimicrobiales bacterium]